MTGYWLRAAALEDIEEIARYTQREWGARQREKYLKALFSRFGELARNPMVGLARDDIAPGVRSFRAGRHIVIYLPDRGGVQIARVLHESMDVRKHMDDETP